MKEKERKIAGIYERKRKKDRRNIGKKKKERSREYRKEKERKAAGIYERKIKECRWNI